MIAVTLGTVCESSLLGCVKRLKCRNKVDITHKRAVPTAQIHHSAQRSVQNFKLSCLMKQPNDVFCRRS